MKKSLVALLTLVGLLILTSAAWCDPITSATYGSVDEYLYSEALSNSGDATELAWINLKLGTTYTTMTKTNTSGGAGWQVTDTLNVYAYDLVSDEPAYFLIKTGNIGEGMPDTFLYKNLASFDWAVINLAVMEGLTIKNIGKLSHIDEVGETQVPEPATLILLGLGLLGIAGIRRKK